MQERLNLHIDEAGNQNLSEGVYLVAVILHEHNNDLAVPISAYEERLKFANLADIPFHGKDLLHGKEAYSNVSIGDRKRLLTQFAHFVRSLPVEYFTLSYSKHETHNHKQLETRIRKDLVALIFDELSYFQRFDTISVYYDDGQKALSIALHHALEFALANNVTVFRDANHPARRLLQAADYICTIERISIAYEKGTQTKTHERFFGNRRSFTRSYMKQLLRKRFTRKGR